MLAQTLGMISTLVGLSVDAGQYGRPRKRLAKPLAVALLTTLYGAFVANVFDWNYDKLEGYTDYEVTYREMVITGLRNIARGSPRNMGTRCWQSAAENAGKT